MKPELTWHICPSCANGFWAGDSWPWVVQGATGVLYFTCDQVCGKRYYDDMIEARKQLKVGATV